MHTELNLFGQETPIIEKDLDHVKELLKRYPAFSQDSGKFLFVALKERANWITYLTEEQQQDLRHFLGSCININRRRQELLSQSSV